MLTPTVYQKAWLSFAPDKGLREQSVAGGQLEQRTSDAVEMLVEGRIHCANAAGIFVCP
jgi:hypothetical protein